MGFKYVLSITLSVVNEIFLSGLVYFQEILEDEGKGWAEKQEFLKKNFFNKKLKNK